MEKPFNKEKLKMIFDRIYVPELTITEVICTLKNHGITQGQTHYILWHELKDKDLFTFSDLHHYIVNAPCWADALDQNISLNQELENFLKKIFKEIADIRLFLFQCLYLIYENRCTSIIFRYFQQWLFCTDKIPDQNRTRSII